MNIPQKLIVDHCEFTKWRRDLHAHPELAFGEDRTARFVEDQLKSYGLDVSIGVGKTGIVGTLQGGSSSSAIGLRADMDALPIDEENTFSYRSKSKGVMHACGHDGHTVMLLAAAKYLAEHGTINGTVQFIFQPAEEANSQGSGAQAMIADGLFERFPMDCVFAMHNLPGLKAGAVATRAGPIMASMDLFEVTIEGKGTHGAFPELGIDPVVIAAALISGWQTIISRNISSQTSAVISATSIRTPDSFNVLPAAAVIKGSIRSLLPEVQECIKRRFHILTENIAISFGAKASIDYRQEYPITNNDISQTEFASNVIESVVGGANFIRDADPIMGSEDFAYMLNEKPGCYFWIGNSSPKSAIDLEGGVGRDNDLVIPDSCMVHKPNYDFNDSIIPLGAGLFVRLAESYLAD